MARMLLSVLGIFLCAGALAQNVALKGVVKDNTGEKLTGVSIIVENTSTGTTTNSDGEYSIEAPKGATLVFFFLGFETQRVEVGNRTVVDVVMSQTAVGMDEVVVVGYGTQSRRTITSAVTKIDGDLVKGTPVNTLGEALKGKIAGARVYSSNNTPGADPVIRIRGGSSIDGNNDPLILVDGVTPAYGYNATSLNPEYYAYIYDFDNRNKRLSIVGGLDWEIIDGLKATVDASTYNHVTRKSSFRKRGYFSNLTPTTESFNELTRTKLDAYVNYSRTFAEKHSLSAMAGYSYSRDKTNAFAASAEGGGSDLTPTLTAQPDRTSSTSSFSEIVMLSYFGRINYDYKKKYMLTATFRADGSSKFLKGNQWGYFPAMSAGWMISEENFMESTRRVVDDLKLRVSYGQTGNNYISVNDARGKYNVNFYNGNPGLHPAVMPNQDLQWEVTTQLDAGFDLSMFNNRLMVTADYFNRLTDNLIYSKDMPNTTGFSSVKTNIGKVRFYGFDLEISSRNIVKKNFSWESKFTWSYVKNKVVKLPDNGLPQNRVDGIRVGNTNEYFGGIAEGEPLYQVVAFKMKHIIRTPEQLAAAIYDSYSKGYNPDDGTTVKGRKNMGDYEWVNRPGTTKAVVNGEEVEQINSEDKFVIGYSVPHSTGGFSNTFRYKGLSLNVYLDWAIGHTIRHAQMARQFINTFTGNTALNAGVLDTWSPQNPDAKYARFYSGGESVSANFKNDSDVFAFKGDYLCIRELSLAWDLPKKFVSKLGMQGASITLAGNNLHYFTAVPGVSPEVGTMSTNAAGYNNYPPIRRISLGIKVIF